MRKKDLVEFVAGTTNISKRDAGMVVAAVVEGLRSGLIEDGEVGIVGFGSFKVKDKPARTARNPKTGETVDVEARRVIKFKPSGELKTAVQ